MSNGPRVFWCQVVEPVVGHKPYLNSGEMKVSARGPKSAAETFIISDYCEALHFKPGVVVVSVRERGTDDPPRIFSITTTVEAKEIRRP